MTTVMNPADVKAMMKKTFTLKGRIFHPNLLVPVPKDPKKPDSPLKYNVMFAFTQADNAAVLAEIANFLQIAKQSLHPQVPIEYWSNPLKKFETYKKRNGQPNAEYLRGHYWVNASSGKDYQPQIVRQTTLGLVAETNPAEIYSGRNAVVNIGFYAFDNELKGLSTNINAVMLLDGGEKVVTGGVNVDAIFGGFAQDMGIAAPAAGANPFGQYGQQPQTTAPQAQPASAAPAAQPAWTAPLNPTSTPAAGNGGGFI